MTVYLLVVTEEDSYNVHSVWSTEQSAKIEVRHLVEKTGLSIYCFNIIPMEVNG